MGLSVIVTCFYGVPVSVQRLREIYLEHTGSELDVHNSSLFSLKMGVSFELSTDEGEAYIVVGRCFTITREEDLMFDAPSDDSINRVKTFCEQWNIPYWCAATVILSMG